MRCPAPFPTLFFFVFNIYTTRGRLNNSHLYNPSCRFLRPQSRSYCPIKTLMLSPSLSSYLSIYYLITGSIRTLKYLFLLPYSTVLVSHPALEIGEIGIETFLSPFLLTTVTTFDREVCFTRIYSLLPEQRTLVKDYLGKCRLSLEAVQKHSLFHFKINPCQLPSIIYFIVRKLRTF